MCCYLHRSDGYADDVCIQGACLSNYWTGQYFVIGCTDQNWDEQGSGCSPLWDACGTHHFLNVLRGQLTVMIGRQSGYTHVSRCNDGSFCCGKDNTACCSDCSGIYLNEDGTKILPQSGEIEDTTLSSYTPYSSLIPTSLQTRVATSTSTPTTSPPSQSATAIVAPSADKPKEGLSADGKIGIGVGVPAAVIAALTLWRQCRPRLSGFRPSLRH
jgi:hypothetical protein